jgi:hypothetical protein
VGQPGWLTVRRRLDQDQQRRQTQNELVFAIKGGVFNGHQSNGLSPPTIHHAKNLQKKFTIGIRRKFTVTVTVPAKET